MESAVVWTDRRQERTGTSKKVSTVCRCSEDYYVLDEG